METIFIIFEWIISHTHKRKVFLLIYLTYDVVMSSRLIYYINKRATFSDSMMLHDVLK